MEAAPRHPYADFDAVLIVRHRIGVQRQVTAFLNQLLFDDPDGHPSHGPVPTTTLPEWEAEHQSE